MRRAAWIGFPFVLTVLIAVGGLLLFLRPANGEDPGVLVVRDLGEPGETTIPAVWCDDNGLICVTPDSFEQGFALSTREPHPRFREKGCRAEWRPDFDLAQVGGSGHGAFRSPCSGATFDRQGILLYGPAHRALDRYPIDGDPASFTILLDQLQLGPAGH